MFKKQDSAKDFRKVWICEPKVGHQVSLSKMIIEIKSIKGDVLFWEEVSWNTAKESQSPMMIKDKVQRKAFMRDHVLPNNK